MMPSVKELVPLCCFLQGGEWSEEELVLLAKAVNKFPGGTPKRWEKIADMVGRSVDDVRNPFSPLLFSALHTCVTIIFQFAEVFD